MKCMKNVLSWFLLCVLLLSSVACGTEKTGTAKEENPGEEAWDMSGYDFLMMIESNSEDHIFGYHMSTALYDKVMERCRALEEKYGCTVTIDYSPDVLDESDITARILAGQHFAEFMNSATNNHPAQFCRSGILIPLPELADYLDYENEKKFGSVAALECTMKDSVPYGITPAALPYNMGTGSFLIAYNRDFITEFGLTDLHEYYESKSWTFDTLAELLDTWYLGGETHPHYVLSGPLRGFVELVLLNNGVRFVVEQDGELVTDIYSPSSVHAIEWLKTIESTYGRTSLYHDSYYWDTATFTSGETFMSLACGTHVTLGAYQYDCPYKMGLMPFPSGPDAVYGQFSTYLEGGAMYTFPITADWPEASATVVSDLFEPLEGYGDGDDLTSFYKANVFLDDTDTEIYMHHLDYARNCYWNFGGLALSENIAGSINTGTASELLEKFGGSFEKTIDEEIKGNYEYLQTHMYNR